MRTDKDIPGISCGIQGDNVFEWEVMMMLDEEQDPLYGGEWIKPVGRQGTRAAPAKGESLGGPMRKGRLRGGLFTRTPADNPSIRAGGIFRTTLSFPPTYPLAPPTMRFRTPIFHPNVYPSGEVCISILHPPEDDKYGYESASERWSPVQTPETILLSVISMLGSPNDESAANLEAGKLWREDRKEFRRRVRRCVRDSQEGAFD